MIGRRRAPAGSPAKPLARTPSSSGRLAHADEVAAPSPADAGILGRAASALLVETCPESPVRTGGPLASLADRGGLLSHVDNGFVGRNGIADQQEGHAGSGNLTKPRARHPPVPRRDGRIGGLVRRREAALGVRYCLSYTTWWLTFWPAALVPVIVTVRDLPSAATTMWLVVSTLPFSLFSM